MDTPDIESINPAPWEKQEAESAKAYSAFITYRNMPAHERSLKRAVKLLFGRDISSKLRMFQTWSAKYRWVFRSQAWDIEVDRLVREKKIKEVEEMNTRHIKIAQAMQQKIIERLRELEAMELTAADLIAWLNAATKIERLARGEPETIEEKITSLTIGYDIPTPDLRKMLEARLGQLGSVKDLQLTSGSFQEEDSEDKYIDEDDYIDGKYKNL